MIGKFIMAGVAFAISLWAISDGGFGAGIMFLVCAIIFLIGYRSKQKIAGIRRKVQKPDAKEPIV